MKSLSQKVDLFFKLGSGFFATGYDLFVMDIVLAILQGLSDEDPSGMGFSLSTSSLIACATSVGGVVGMLAFAVIGDRISPLFGLIITGIFVVVGSLLSAACVRSDTMSLCAQLAIYRAVLGIGMGGEFPITAAIAGEGSGIRVRGRELVSIFSLQGVGLLFSSLLGYIILEVGCPLEFTWRFLLAFTSIPGLISIWLRVRLHRDLSRGTAPKATVQRTTSGWDHTMTILRSNTRILLGTALTWFIMDVTFFGTGVFRHSVSEQVYITREGTSADVVATHDALFGLIIAGAAMLGYVCAIIWLDRVGRWTLQTYGFVAMGLSYVAMALTVELDSSIVWLNVFIFACTFYFTTFGPNTTTFMIPSDLFAKDARTLCHGISAASGKLGAVVGIAIFPPLMEGLGLGGTMFFCAGVAFLGTGATVALLRKKEVDESVANAQAIQNQSPNS